MLTKTPDFTQYSQFIGKFPLFTIHLEKHQGWIRILGIGLSWKNTKLYPSIFSERYGHSKYIQIANYRLKYLKRT